MQSRHFGMSRLSLCLLAAVSVLAACGRDDQRTAGKKVDEIGADARQAGSEVRQAAADTADSAIRKTRDAAITLEVKSRLARDDKLSALAIEVDSTGGLVILRGSAPDTASRGRASELARGVEGVVEVQNDLNVQRSN